MTSIMDRTAAEAPAATDWPARATEGLRVLNAAREYLHAKAAGTFVPPRVLGEEARSMSGRLGDRGKSKVQYHLDEYIAVIDKAQARALREATEAAGTQELSDEQRALAYEKAISRIKATAVRLSGRDGLCPYGLKELCVSIGVEPVMADMQMEFAVNVTVSVPARVIWGDGADATAARRQVQEVVDRRIAPSMKRLMAKDEVPLALSGVSISYIRARGTGQPVVVADGD